MGATRRRRLLASDYFFECHCPCCELASPATASTTASAAAVSPPLPASPRGAETAVQSRLPSMSRLAVATGPPASHSCSIQTTLPVVQEAAFQRRTVDAALEGWKCPRCAADLVDITGADVVGEGLHPVATARCPCGDATHAVEAGKLITERREELKKVYTIQGID